MVASIVYLVLFLQYQVTHAANIDFESTSKYSLKIKVTDNGTPIQSFEKIFKVVITDVNEKPSGLYLDNSKVFTTRCKIHVVK